MPHTALAQALDEDLIETVDAIAAPLRTLSPHIAEMTHAQELSDVTILCECLWAEVQKGPESQADRASFHAYLERRRKVGFSTDELQAIVATMGRVVGRRLDAASKSGSMSPTDLEEGLAELAAALATLEHAITETDGLARE